MIVRRLVCLPHTLTLAFTYVLNLCPCASVYVSEQSARFVDKEGTQIIGGFLIGDVSYYCCYFYILLFLLRLKSKNKQQIQQQLHSFFSCEKHLGIFNGNSMGILTSIRKYFY